MQCIAVVVLASVLAAAQSTSVNYCGARMCGNTNAHTFCQFPEGPSPNCVGYISAPLSIEEKSRLLSRLNRRRNEAAAGRMRGWPSAGNMLKLRWVEELAREAQRWADQCRPPRAPEERDQCRDLYSLTVGQCVASVVGEAPGLRVESMVDIWYMQSMLYKGNVTFYMLPSSNASFYGDFAQIIWAHSYMVGCGRSRFMTHLQGRLRSVERLVCNIAPYGPYAARPLWAPAAPAASCPPRAVVDSTFTALCDYQWNPEQNITAIDNSSMTLEDHLLLNTVLEIENNKTIDYLGSLDEIYLTRVAIATMENTITTRPFYNSMQRREIIEVIDMLESEVNSATATQAQVVPITDATLAPSQETTTIKVLKITKKRVSFIGRPKPYNMEELTDFDDKTENNTPIEEIPRTEKELYAEYEFVEPVEDNITTTVPGFSNVTDVSSLFNGVYLGKGMEPVTGNHNVKENENVAVYQDILREVVTMLYQNSSVYVPPAVPMEDNSDQAFDNITVASANSTQNVVNDSSMLNDTFGDIYNFSDSETVRELQEALENIEKQMQPKVEKQGKVRRDLRDPPLELTTQIDKRVSDLILNEEIERNKSIERGPMYNMVLKYMPYLKQYENSILPMGDDAGSSSSSIVNVLSPSIMLVFIMFVIV